MVSFGLTNIGPQSSVGYPASLLRGVEDVTFEYIFHWRDILILSLSVYLDYSFEIYTEKLAALHM